MADAKVVRAWLKEQGINVADRGRLDAKLVRKYEAAHKVAEVLPELPVSTEIKKIKTTWRCGFCGTGDHSNCREVSRNGVNALYNGSDLVWCKCALNEHKDN